LKCTEKESEMVLKCNIRKVLFNLQSTLLYIKGTEIHSNPAKYSKQLFSFLAEKRKNIAQED